MYFEARWHLLLHKITRISRPPSLCGDGFPSPRTQRIVTDEEVEIRYVIPTSAHSE